MSDTAPPESGARSRTRRAILSAAASLLGRDRGATLADIAQAADVGRSTLHRYFPDREELVNAVIRDSIAVVDQAVRDAAPDQGTAREAMRRLVAAMVEVGDRLIFLWGDPRVLESYEGDFDEKAPGDPDRAPLDQGWTLELIKRGQAEGVLDPEAGPEWIQSVLWSLVYTGVAAADQGMIPRHGVTATVIRTFENGVHARPAP